MLFDQLGLDSKILQAVAKAGHDTPTPIQEEAIPKILEGHDLLASAGTGTGKTAAFSLPLLQLLLQNPKKNKNPKCLILTPTRELAYQVLDQMRKYSTFLPQLKTVCIVGGVPYPKQKKSLMAPYDILIATPGRLLDLIAQKRIHLTNIDYFVLDEADRMLDMGFVEPVEEIASKLPKNRQTLFFSATLEGSVMKLANKLLQDPLSIKIEKPAAEQHQIEQIIHYADDIEHKNELLDHILSNAYASIIFTATKRHADQLAKELRSKNYLADALHGDMNQRKREQTMKRMRMNQIQTLVATDVAARGIDISHISHVINFDLPDNVEDYVHRIGRTGRAGANGTAISFVSPRDGHMMRKIEEYTGQKVRVESIVGMEPKRHHDHTKAQEQKSNKRRSSKASFPKRSFRQRRSSYRK